MTSFIRKVFYIPVIIYAVLNFNCKDDNIGNAYLNLTGSYLMDDEVNLNRDKILINVNILDENSNLVTDAGVSLILPNGAAMIKKTNNSGNVKFILDKNVKGNCELSASSETTSFTVNKNFEISDAFNYTFSIYLKVNNN